MIRTNDSGLGGSKNPGETANPKVKLPGLALNPALTDASHKKKTDSGHSEKTISQTPGIPGDKQIKKVVIVGLPNTGKTQIFNNLTGEYNVVSNYPGTTIEMKRTLSRLNGRDYEIIDTPGLHCFYIHSEEEIAVRDMLLREHPDVIVQCIDTTHFKQSLLLTAELLELETPMVIVLNSMDETARHGIWIDSTNLERMLGVSVVESVAIRGIGKEEIKNAITRARKSTWNVKYDPGIERGLIELMAALPFELEFKHKIAILLLLNDSFIGKYLENLFGRSRIRPVLKEVHKIRRLFKSDIRRAIHDKRSQWVEEAASAVVKKHKIRYQGFSRHLTQAVRRPFLGVPILFFYICVVYYSVVHVSETLEHFLDFLITKPTTGFITSLPLPAFWNDFLIGSYGLLSLGLFNAICTVLPIMSVFFFIFGIFEDSGYIANFCVLSREICKKIGVPGKAITSLILGFSCRTMATLNTRGLTVRREKYIAVFLIAFAIPCSAQLGLSIAILGKSGFSAFLIAFGALTMLELSAGLFLNRILKKESESFFIQMLPDMHFPSLKAVLVKTYYRTIWFLKEAVPIFAVAAVVLFTLDKTGALSFFKKMLNPIVVAWVGLPENIVDVLMLSLASRAAAAGLTLNMVNAGMLNYMQSIVAVVLTATFFPCFANMIAMAKEMGIKTAITMSFLIFMSSFFMAGLLHWILVLVMP